MNFVGVDGCPKGWFAVSIHENDHYEINIFDHIETLWQEFKKSALILVDIPIGEVGFVMSRRGNYWAKEAPVYFQRHHARRFSNRIMKMPAK